MNDTLTRTPFSLTAVLLGAVALCACAGTATSPDDPAAPTEAAVPAHDEPALQACNAWLAGHLRGEDVATFYSDDASYEESHWGEFYKSPQVSLVPYGETADPDTVRIAFAAESVTRDPVRELIACRGRLSISDSDPAAGTRWSAEHEVVLELIGFAAPAARLFTVVPLELHDSARNRLVRTPLGCMTARAGTAPPSSVCQYEVEMRDAHGDVYRTHQVGLLDANGVLVDVIALAADNLLDASVLADTHQVEAVRTLDLGQGLPAVSILATAVGRRDDPRCPELVRVSMTTLEGWGHGRAQLLLAAEVARELSYPTDPAGTVCGPGSSVVRELELVPRTGQAPEVHVTVVRSTDATVPVGLRDVYIYDPRLDFYPLVETIDPTAP